MGLSAWKSAGGNRWALRMNPSSGNLHPTECYLILPPLGPHPPCVAHYDVFRHELAVRAVLPPILWQETTEHFGGLGFGIGLTSICWRESWKYGERALRYTQHDVGHAMAALSMAANLFGWRLTYLRDAPDRQLETLLGLDRTTWPPGEEERVALIAWVHNRHDTHLPLEFGDSLAKAYSDLSFGGEPNRLSPGTVHWPLIDDTWQHLEKPPTRERWQAVSYAPVRARPESVFSAATLIRQRRSAQRFDGDGCLDKETLLSMLDKTLPRNTAAPFSLGLGPPRVDLVLFVHRVINLHPGMYVFLRSDGKQSLRARLHDSFDWTPISASWPLFLLKAGDYREIAAAMSCHQDIAGDSALSLGMLARFDETLRSAPWRYRMLFWETGMIGQVLYLEAEAHGVRGTGIGCYFDDVVHQLLGVESEAYQSLYHFTIGVPIEDPRLTTLPAYHHLKRIQPPASPE